MYQYLSEYNRELICLFMETGSRSAVQADLEITM